MLQALGSIPTFANNNLQKKKKLFNSYPQKNINLNLESSFISLLSLLCLCVYMYDMYEWVCAHPSTHVEIRGHFWESVISCHYWFHQLRSPILCGKFCLP